VVGVRLRGMVFGVCVRFVAWCLAFICGLAVGRHLGCGVLCFVVYFVGFVCLCCLVGWL